MNYNRKWPNLQMSLKFFDKGYLKEFQHFLNILYLFIFRVLKTISFWDKQYVSDINEVDQD